MPVCLEEWSLPGAVDTSPDDGAPGAAARSGRGVLERERSGPDGLGLLLAGDGSDPTVQLRRRTVLPDAGPVLATGIGSVLDETDTGAVLGGEAEGEIGSGIDEEGPRFAVVLLRWLAALAVLCSLVGVAAELGLLGADDGGAFVEATEDADDPLGPVAGRPTTIPVDRIDPLLLRAGTANPLTSVDPADPVDPSSDADSEGEVDTAGATSTDPAGQPPTTSADAASSTTGADQAGTTTTPGSTTPASTGTTTAPTPTATATTRPPTTPPPTTAPSPTTTRPPTTRPPTTQPPTTSGPTGQLVWSDEFNSLDTSRWAVEHSTYGDGNNELQCYRPENVSVVNGKLVLRAVTETYTCPNGSTRSVTSGMIRSRGVSLTPGHAIEFRVKLTPANESDQGGLWPAVWASGWGGGGWPRGGEVDFLEVMTANDPTRSIYSIHYQRPNGSHGVSNRPVFGSQNFSASWHTVRFHYGHGGALAWYLDGAPVFSVNAADTIQGYPSPFDQAIGEIKINLALGGRPGPLSPNAVGSAGATFEMDYIRVFRL